MGSSRLGFSPQAYEVWLDATRFSLAHVMLEGNLGEIPGVLTSCQVTEQADTVYIPEMLRL